mgnify:CR=1 FL=1
MNAQLAQLSAPAPRARATWLTCVAAASCGHLLLALWMHDARSQPAAALPLPPTEIELSTPPPAPAPPPVTPDPPPPAAAPHPVPRARVPRQAPPPAPARAGALLTAPETAPEPAAEPVRFVSDPNGRSFGTGSVARGGSAEHADAGARLPAPKPLPAASGLRITPADKLHRQPALLGDGCRGYFPEHAHLDQGDVTLLVTVLPNGKVARVELEAETPAGEGFGGAARACLTRGEFVPALDERGEPTAARTRVVVRFAR